MNLTVEELPEALRHYANWCDGVAGEDVLLQAAELIETLERMNLNQFKKIAELQEGKRVDTGLLRLQAKRVEQLEQALTDLLPYTDSIICYASTISEHDGNRVAKVLADLAEELK